MHIGRLANIYPKRNYMKWKVTSMVKNSSKGATYIYLEFGKNVKCFFFFGKWIIILLKENGKIPPTRKVYKRAKPYKLLQSKKLIRSTIFEEEKLEMYTTQPE